ncbi:uncharacterized protein G2W53_016331 [Senna tora]|uniref:Uncharacterized protein n=1 Tax=Senna tora TaxID=362788 RepID=A0A834TP57_9FABA|nr:uncharacterized protein G2W53_016331 [Senna tora]
MVDVESVIFEPTREWCDPYLPRPRVPESPVTQNLEELYSSHLGNGHLRVIPTWSCGLFPYCNIGVAEVGLKAIALGFASHEAVTSLVQALEDKW